MDRDSKIKHQQYNFEGNGGVMDEQLKKELINMRIQHESLFEKVKLNSDKLVAVEIEITNTKQGERSFDGRGANSPFADDTKLQ